MWDLCRLIFGLVVDLFRSRAALEAEVLVLKQQIIVFRRGKPNRMPAARSPSFDPIPWFGGTCRFPIFLGLEVQASSGPSSGAK